MRILESRTGTPGRKQPGCGLALRLLDGDGSAVAEHYSINVKSVRKLVHEAGVRGFKLKEELRSYLAEHFDDWRDERRVA
jgi:hypothetical protein